MQIINWIDTFMTPIVWFIDLSQKVFQILTSDRTKQVYKAIALFIGILCAAIILGFAKTTQIAFVSAFEAFIEALEIPEASTEILIVQESEPLTPESIAPDLRVRSLRKAATAKGISHAGRMKKADLLVALSQFRRYSMSALESVLQEVREEIEAS